MSSSDHKAGPGSQEADELAKLVGDEEPKFVQPPEREIKAWHKPRKQWVREHQWGANCAKLIDEHLSADDEFTYLSLPGPDLLDVRFMSDMCLGWQKQLRFLGFNNPDDESSSDVRLISKGLAEVCQSGHVSGFSTIVPDKLENLAAPHSVANRTVAEFGSFDAINLDLCNSVLGHIPVNQQSTYYDAIHALFEHQKNSRTKPFLLFLTTRTERTTINANALARLTKAVKKNLQNPDFETRLRRDQNIKAFEVHQLAQSGRWPPSWGQRKLSKFVSTAIAKWFLSLLWDGAPSWYLEVLDCCEYKVFVEADMVSLSFLCTPIRRPASDAMQLSKLKSTVPVPPSERQCAMQVLHSLNSTFDLDERLRNAPDYKALLDRATRLMEAAGYDGTKYARRFNSAN